MYSLAIFHPISKWSPALVGMDTFSHIAAGPLKSDKRTLLAALLIDLLELAGLPSLQQGSFRIRTVEWVQGVIDSI